MTFFSITDKWQQALPIKIPPLWQVIYYEGIHGHHILFSPEDLSTFQREPAAVLATQDTQQVTTLGMRLLAARSFRDMVDLIDSQPLPMRWYMFRLYCQWLAITTHELKQSAH